MSPLPAELAELLHVVDGTLALVNGDESADADALRYKLEGAQHRARRVAPLGGPGHQEWQVLVSRLGSRCEEALCRVGEGLSIDDRPLVVNPVMIARSDLMNAVHSLSEPDHLSARSGRRFCATPSPAWLRELARITRAVVRTINDLEIAVSDGLGSVMVAEPADVLKRVLELNCHLAGFHVAPHFGWSPVADDEMCRYHRALSAVVQGAFAAWGIEHLFGRTGSYRMSIDIGGGRVDTLTRQHNGPNLGAFAVQLPLRAIEEASGRAMLACADGLDQILAEGPVIDRILNSRDGDVRDLVFVADHKAVIEERDAQIAAAAQAATPAPLAGREGADAATSLAPTASTPNPPRNPLTMTEVDGQPVLRLLQTGKPPLELTELSPGQYAALDALRRAFPEQIERDRFAELAGLADPARELSRATTRHPELESAIIRPLKSSKRKAGAYGLAPLQAA